MRRSTLVAILGLVTGWLAGCGRTGVAEFLDDELGDEGSSDDGSDGPTTDESGSSESTTEESTTDDSTDTSSDDQTTTESTSETTGDTDGSTSETTGDTDESTDTDTSDVTDTDTTDAGGEVCGPEPGDDPCTTCAKQFCCGELEACAVDEDCTCVLDCYTGGGQLGQCFGQCGAFGNQPFEQLADCATTDCASEC